MEYKYLFGPVPSRRLGYSLGVDLLPQKICSLDCVYCESGKTMHLTTERKEYVPISQVIKELDNYLIKKPKLDYITFSGSGEPTLHSGLGKIVKHIKKNFPKYKIALLTNGTLFNRPKVIEDVKQIDVIAPSLDTATPKLFNKINRPHRQIRISGIIEGLKKLRKSFKGQIWLEIFIIPGCNDLRNKLLPLKKVIKLIAPDKIHINTLDRPGTEIWVKTAYHLQLKIITRFFGRKAQIISSFQPHRIITGYSKDIEKTIWGTIRRRPCTAKDLALATGLHINEIHKYLYGFVKDKKVSFKHLPRGIFYTARQKVKK